MSPFESRRWIIPFRSTLLPQVFCDTLVVGCGVAGLRTAIGAAAHGETIILAKDALEVSSTAWAQGGIATAMAADDSTEAHVRDTLEAGAGLCDERAVRVLVEEGQVEVAQLLEWGMRVDRQADGAPSLGLEGGHHHARILHADGDATGRELFRTLLLRARATPGIRIFERCHALDVITSGEGRGRARGLLTWHPRYGLQIVWARAVVLASGGAGQVFRESSAPAVATGDAIAMGWRAGASLSDLEFTQFHPTALYVAGAPRRLISEAVRGEGAHLVDRQGRRFLDGTHPMAELAPRDIVSRAIVEHIGHTGEPCVFLDARHLGERFGTRFPGLARMLAGFGLDASRDRIPVHPAAHFTIGGVHTDLDGRSSVPGLYAAGEASATGVHGANRLASNGLLEGLVFGARVARAIAGDGLPDPVPTLVDARVETPERAELDLADIRSSLRSAMWRNVGILRSGPRLAEVVGMFEFWGRYAMEAVFDAPEGWETQNLLTAGWLMTRAAGAREESRGVHNRADAPAQSAALRGHYHFRRGESAPRFESAEAGVRR